jgi:hypothetical protein
MGGGASIWFCFSTDSAASELATAGPSPAGATTADAQSPHAGEASTVPGEEASGRPAPLQVPDRSAPAVEPSEVTPRRERAMQSGVPATPTGELINVYRYYCPLCMFYYEDIMRSSCCGNYCCYTCTIDYLDKKGLKVHDLHVFACFASQLDL